MNLIIDHSTQRAMIKAAMLYESPFSDLSPRGQDALFRSTEADDLLELIEKVRSAVAG
jgi:type I restriction enzyme R subunit